MGARRLAVPPCVPGRPTLLAAAALFAPGAGEATAQDGLRLTTDNLWTFRQLSAPEWSPDGSSIAFTVTEGETNSSAIYVTDLEGNVTRLPWGATP